MVGTFAEFEADLVTFGIDGLLTLECTRLVVGHHKNGISHFSRSGTRSDLQSSGSR